MSLCAWLPSALTLSSMHWLRNRWRSWSTERLLHLTPSINTSKEWLICSCIYMFHSKLGGSGVNFIYELNSGTGTNVMMFVSALFHFIVALFIGSSQLPVSLLVCFSFSRISPHLQHFQTSLPQILIVVCFLLLYFRMNSASLKVFFLTPLCIFN